MIGLGLCSLLFPRKWLFWDSRVRPYEVPTPLKYTYNFAHRDAIAFIGTSDPWSIVPEVQALSQKQQVPMYTYENANHSLETGDTLENLKILQDVMGKTKGFLKRK